MAKKTTTLTAAQVKEAKRVRRQILRRPGAMSATDRMTVHAAEAVIQQGPRTSDQ